MDEKVLYAINIAGIVTKIGAKKVQIRVWRYVWENDMAGQRKRQVPPGFDEVSVVLSEQKSFIVKRWENAAMKTRGPK